MVTCVGSGLLSSGSQGRSVFNSLISLLQISVASLPQDREFGRAVKTNMLGSEMAVEGQPHFQSQLLGDLRQHVTITCIVYMVVIMLILRAN